MAFDENNSSGWCPLKVASVPINIAKLISIVKDSRIKNPKAGWRRNDCEIWNIVCEL